MEHIYKQIGWGIWTTGENYFIGHSDRLESLNILYSIEGEKKFAGLGIDDLGVFEFGGEINQAKIDFTKIYRRETLNPRAIKGKINYYGKRFDGKEPAGYKGEWGWNEKSGPFTFISGNLEKTEISSPLNLTQFTMLEMTRRKLKKLDGRFFKDYLKEMSFAP